MASTTMLKRLPTRSELENICHRAMKAVAQEAVTIIIRRTAQGLDADGNEFAPYSTDYGNKKAMAGRQADRVDLTVTGDLLNKLKLLRVEDVARVIIGWGPAQHRSYEFVKGAKGRGKNRGAYGPGAYQLKITKKTVSIADIVEGLSAKRDFFAIRSPDEIARLVAIFDRHVADGLATFTR